MRLLPPTLASAAESKDFNLDNIKQALLRVQTPLPLPCFSITNLGAEMMDRRFADARF